MAIQLDDKEFDDIVAEERHKKVIKTLNSLISTIASKQDDSVVKAIGDLEANAIKGFVEAIKQIGPSNNTDLKELGQNILQSLSSNNELLIEVRALLIESNKPRELLVKRGEYSGVIEKVTATIVNNKPKYQD